MTVLDAPRIVDHAVTTRGLVRDYGDGAGLAGVDLVVPHGCVYGLVGPNGAGKTTLLSILTGLRRADAGTVTLDVPREQIAVCPDTPEFEPWLTAAEVVALARGMGGSTGSMPPRVLEQTGLADAADRRVGGFSRGMTQRLGLAAALATDPRLVILDEPTSALDPAGRAEILTLVAQLAGSRTVILSSHILADVQRVAGEIGVLAAGRLLYQGAPQTLIDTHLRPAWELRVRGPVEPVAAELRRRPWVDRVDVVAADTVRVAVDSVADGEQGLPRVVVDTGSRLSRLTPLDANLESAFLALTRTGEDNQ